MERITTEEVMYKLDMFQDRFGKIDEFGWWDLEGISADAGTQFTSTEFQEKYHTRSVWLSLAAPEHQETNRQVEVTWRMLRTITHSRGSFGSLYSFSVNVYSRSYFPGTTNQRLDKQRRRSDHAI